ncbi:MAG: ABC transporter ATP-binding protein [Candidatus Pelethousia sp.]|nr:ABC transporter ATP-binding protein [Candidatus Pelethousia sp.]
MKRLLVYLRDYKKQTVLAPLFKMLEACFELLVPLMIARMIDVGIAGGDKALIMRLSLGLVALGLIGLACVVTAQYYAAKAAVGFGAKLRYALLERLCGLSFSQIDELGASTMIARMTSDVNQVQTGVNMTLRLFLRSPFIVFGAAVMAFTIDAPAAMVFACAIPALSLVVFGIMRWTIPLYRRVQGRLDGVLRITRENLTGARVLRAFGKEAAETTRFDESNRALFDEQRYVGRISALMNPLTYMLINAAVLYLIWAGALRVELGALTQGQVVALYNYMSQILVELIKLANFIVTMTRALASARRVVAALELSPSNESAGGAKIGLDQDAPLVEFCEVGMAYEGAGAEALSDVSFSARRGQTIGVIGGTGAGKSTLVQLIPRFYEATRGRVLVEGRDVREWDVSALRRKIGVVPQKALLFSGTIAANLRWGNPSAAEDDLWHALDTAQASEVAEAKGGGLEARVEQNGRNFSGGQRQRLTIARALVKKPDILILDDSASALDYATDARLRRALRALPERPLVFIVSQRAASIAHADTIIVLEDGRVVGMGTHAELLKTCPVYKEIYDSQFPPEVAQ